MHVTEIVVSAGRTFNHPYESYSNLKPAVTLKATLSESDDAETCVKELQAKAESIVEDHKRNLLQSIDEMETLTRKQQEAQRLESMIRKAQSDLDRLRGDAVMAVPALAGCAAEPEMNEPNAEVVF